MPLVEGRVTTGEGVFHAGNNLLASQNSTSAYESEPKCGDKASVTNRDKDEKREKSNDVGVFGCVL